MLQQPCNVISPESKPAEVGRRPCPLSSTVCCCCTLVRLLASPLLLGWHWGRHLENIPENPLAKTCTVAQTRVVSITSTRQTYKRQLDSPWLPTWMPKSIDLPALINAVPRPASHAFHPISLQMRAIRNFSRGVRTTPHSAFGKHLKDDDDEQDSHPPLRLPPTESANPELPNVGRSMVNQSGNVGVRMRVFGRVQREMAKTASGASFAPASQGGIAGDEGAKCGSSVDPIIGGAAEKIDDNPRQRQPPIHLISPRRTHLNVGGSEAESLNAVPRKPAWNSSMRMEPKKTFDSTKSVSVDPVSRLNCVSPGVQLAENPSTLPVTTSRVPVFGRHHRRTEQLHGSATSKASTGKIRTQPSNTRSRSVPQKLATPSSPAVILPIRRRPQPRVAPQHQNTRPAISRTYLPPKPQLVQQKNHKSEFNSLEVNSTKWIEGRWGEETVVTGPLDRAGPSPKPRQPRVQEEVDPPEHIDLSEWTSPIVQLDYRKTNTSEREKIPEHALEKLNPPNGKMNPRKVVVEGGESSSMNITSLIDHVVYFAYKEEIKKSPVTNEISMDLSAELDSIKDPSTLDHVIAEVQKDREVCDWPTVERQRAQTVNELVCQVEFSHVGHEASEDVAICDSKNPETVQSPADTFRGIDGVPSQAHDVVNYGDKEPKLFQVVGLVDDDDDEAGLEPRLDSISSPDDLVPETEAATAQDVGKMIPEEESHYHETEFHDVPRQEASCTLPDQMSTLNMDNQSRPPEVHESFSAPRAKRNPVFSQQHKQQIDADNEEIIQPRDFGPSVDPTDVSFTFDNPSADPLYPTELHTESSNDSSTEYSVVSLQSEPCVSGEECRVLELDDLSEHLKEKHPQKTIGEDCLEYEEWLMEGQDEQEGGRTRKCVIEEREDESQCTKSFVNVHTVMEVTPIEVARIPDNVCTLSVHGDYVAEVSKFKGHPKPYKSFSEFPVREISPHDDTAIGETYERPESPPFDLPRELMPSVSPLFQDSSDVQYHPDSFRFRMETNETGGQQGEPKHDKRFPSRGICEREPSKRVESLAPSLCGISYVKRRQLVLMDPGTNKQSKRQTSGVISQMPTFKKLSEEDDLLASSHTECVKEKLALLKDGLFSLDYRYNSLGIVTKENISELKQAYRDFISTARSAATEKMHYLSQVQLKEVHEALQYAVEQFEEIVDHRVVCQNWLGAWEKGGMLRMKADFLRYLFEVDRKSEKKLRRCNEAYKNARLFFLENAMTNKAEWVYLQMNYASFLYMAGSRGAAQFLSRKLVNNLVTKRCGREIRDRLQSNIKLYSRNF